MKKKIISSILSLAMLLSLLPVAAFAGNTNLGDDDVTVTVDKSTVWGDAVTVDQSNSNVNITVDLTKLNTKGTEFASYLKDNNGYFRFNTGNTITNQTDGAQLCLPIQIALKKGEVTPTAVKCERLSGTTNMDGADATSVSATYSDNFVTVHEWPVVAFTELNYNDGKVSWKNTATPFAFNTTAGATKDLNTWTYHVTWTAGENTYTKDIVINITKTPAPKPEISVVPANLTGYAEDPYNPAGPNADTYTATLDTAKKEIAVTATGLKKTVNTEESNAYWVGIGLTKQENATYACGFGSVPDTIADEAYGSADNTQMVNGKTYDTLYWGAGSASDNTFWTKDASKTGYVSMKVGDDVTTYTIKFDVDVATYALTTSKTGEGTVTTAIAGGDVTKLYEGDKVTITATPGTGKKIASVTVNGELATAKSTEGEDGVATYEVTIAKKDVAVDVSFVAKDAKSHSITVPEEMLTGISNITTVPSTTALTGGAVNVTVTPADGYEVGTISVKDASGKDVTVTDGKFIMPDSDVTVTATAIRVYTVTASAVTNGTATVDVNKAASGDKVTINVKPASGYMVDAVTVTGGDSNITATAGTPAADGTIPYTFTMPAANVTVAVTFKPIEYTISKADATNGSITVSAEKAAAGTEITITPTPNDGYKLGALTVKDADGADITVTENKFTMPAKNVTVSATFIAKSSDAKIAAMSVDGLSVDVSAVAGNKTDVAQAEELTISVPAGTTESALSVTTQADATSVKYGTASNAISSSMDKGEGGIWTAANVAVSDGATIFFEVTAENSNKAYYKLTVTESKVAVGKTETNINDNAISSAGTDVKAAVAATKNTTELKDEAAVAFSNAAFIEADKIANADATKENFEDAALKAALERDKVTVAGGDNVNIYAVPTLELEVVAYTPATDTAPATYTVDITPYVQIVASTAAKAEDVALEAVGGAPKNATVIGEKQDLSGKIGTVEVTIGVPSTLAADGKYVSVKHENDPAVTAKVASGSVVITVDHFSEFAITAATKATLNNLILSSGTLTFNPDTTTYNVSVTNDVESITLTPVAADGFTIKVDNNTVASGSASSAIALTAGQTKAITVVVSGTGLTSTTYTINVTRAEATTPIIPSNPGGGGGGVSSNVTIDRPTNGKVSVTPTAPSKGATVTVNLTPDTGYAVGTVTVTDKDGNAVELTKVSDTQYTFVMPDGKVTVKATFTQVETPSSTGFTDVPADAYYADAVKWAVDKGITNGLTATTFGPNNSCTRGQMVTFLWRAAGSPAAAGTNSFSDVASGEYYYNAVLWAVEKGITNGTSATTFSPNATVNRGQTVTFLYRYAESPAATGATSFTDVAADAFYADAVKWAVAEEITNGTSSTTFSPASNCTRGQIVTFMYRQMAK